MYHYHFINNTMYPKNTEQKSYSLLFSEKMQYFSRPALYIYPWKSWNVMDIFINGNLYILFYIGIKDKIYLDFIEIFLTTPIQL